MAAVAHVLETPLSPTEWGLYPPHRLADGVSGGRESPVRVRPEIRWEMLTGPEPPATSEVRSRYDSRSVGSGVQRARLAARAEAGSRPFGQRKRVSAVRACLRLPGVWPADRSCSGYFQWGEFYSRKSGSCAILRGGSKGWEGCDDSQDIWKLRTVRTSPPVTSVACGPRVSCSRGSLGILGSQGCCSELGNSFPLSPLSQWMAMSLRLSLCA